MVAGSLEIQVLANLARLTSEMGKARQIVGGAMKSIEGTIASVQRAFGALGVGLSVGAMVAFTKNMIGAASALDDIAEKTGASVAELSKLEQQARISGVGMETVEMGLVRLGKSMNMTDEESKKVTKALDALGLKADEISKMDTAVALQVVADKMNQFGDSSGKTALAMDLFGRSGAQLLPFLKDMANDGKLAANVTAEQAAKAEELEKSFRRLGNDVRLVGQAFALDLIPRLQDSVDAFKKSSQEGNIFLGVLSGIKAFFSGNELQKAAKATIEISGKIFQAENDLLTARAVGNARAAAAAQKRIDALGQELKAIQAVQNASPASQEKDNWDKMGRGVLNYAAATAKAAAAVKELESPFRNLLKMLESEQQIKKELTATDKLLFELQHMKPELLERLTAAERKHLEELAKKITLEQNERRVNEEIIKTLKEREEQQNRMNQVLADFNQTQSEALQQIEFETSLYGMGEKQRETAIALRQLEIAYQKAQVDLGEEELETLKKIYELTKERIPGAIAAREGARAAEEAFKKAQEEAKRASEEIERLIGDGLMRAFEAGKGWAKAFRDTLFNMFKTLVLRPLIKPIAVGAAGTVGGWLGIPGMANASGGGLGIGDFLGLANSASGLFGGAAAGAGVAGVGAGGTGAFSGAVAGAGASGAAGGVLSTIGAAMPYIGIAIAIASLIGGRNKKIPATSLGDMGATFDPMGGMLSQWEGQFGTGAGADNLQKLQKQYAQSAMALGINPAATSFYYGANTGKQGQNPMFRLGGGAAGGAWFDSGVETAATDQNIADASARAVLTALKGSQMPEFLRKYFDGIVAESLDAASIQQAIDFGAALKGIRDSLTMTGLEIARAQIESLNTALGTNASTVDAWKSQFLAAIDAGTSPESVAQWQALGQAIDLVTQAVTNARTAQGNLADQFTSESVALANAQKAVTEAFAAHNAIAPSTRDEFAAIVRSLDVTTDSGQKLLEELQAIAPAFDLVTNAAVAAAEAQAAAQQAFNQQARELEIRIVELSGNSLEALAMRRADELAALDQALRPQQERIYLLEDEAAAIARASEIAATRRDMEIRLMELTGNMAGATAARRALELSNLDESLHDLARQIYAAEDATSVLENRTQALVDAENQLRSAYQREVAEKEALIGRMAGYVQSLRQFREQLQFNDATLSPEDRYAGTRQMFEQTRMRAALGDMEAIGQLQSSAKEFLDASRFFNASNPAFQADRENVISAIRMTEDVAQRNVDNATAQLEQARTQTATLISLNENVVTLKQAMDQFIAAQAAGQSQTGIVATEQIQRLDEIVDELGEQTRLIRNAA